MDPRLRVVTVMPLEELWDDDGAFGRHVEHLSTDQIKAILRSGKVRFVEANVGEPLRWTAPDDCFARWRQVAANVTDVERFALEDFPDEWAFVASEWEGRSGERLILLEKHH